jgi:hypothetical protein
MCRRNVTLVAAVLARRQALQIKFCRVIRELESFYVSVKLYPPIGLCASKSCGNLKNY